MALKRLVTREVAEMNTFKAARDRVDILPAGQARAKAQAVVDEMRARIRTRIGS